MTEFGYVIAIGVDREFTIAKRMMITQIEDYQKLGFEVTGNLNIMQKKFIFIHSYWELMQPMVKKAKLKGVNC